MAIDKYTALWLSHTSISDFLICPRAYYLKNVYRDPSSNHKVKLITPPLALGQTVHEVLESLSVLAAPIRFKKNILDIYRQSWQKVSGMNGGFANLDIEMKYQQRGQDMIRRVINHPGPLLNPAVKINMDLPQFWLSEEDNIILCGKIDWLEYLPLTDTVHILDFKTGKGEEDPNSLQLTIYHLLVRNCQKRVASRASYWYLDHSDIPEEKPLPDLTESKNKILKIAKQVKLARSLQHFKCPHQGCRQCLPYEAIIEGKAKFIGVDSFNYDSYALLSDLSSDQPDSFIL